MAIVASAAVVACGPSVETAGSTAGGGGSGGTGGMATSGSTSSGTPAESPTLLEVDLGPTSLNVFHGFEVPEHAIGITAIVEAPDINDIIGISRIRPPTGDPVVFDYSVTGKMNYAFVKQGWVGAATVQSDLPEAWPVQPGLWRILLGSDVDLAPSNVRIWIRKTADGVFHGGVVDVNVFIAPNASTQNYIETVFADLFKDYAGLKLGNVNYLTLDSAFAIIGTYEQYRALLASSFEVTATPALNMFVINKFGGDFGQAIGVAGGIPGSATVHGTTISGVAYQPSGNPAYDATVLRHEIGHLAGLFHTTELASEDTDPISDTVECPVATIQSNPEQCPDITNTMFPIAAEGTDLTTAQLRVIQGSALYRGVFSAGTAPDGPSSAAPQQPSYKAEAGSLIERSDKPMLRNDPTPLERVLGGVWCAVGNADYEALAVRVAGASAPGALRAIVLDETRAELFRARALGAYVRAAAGSERTRALDFAESLARQDGASADLRAAALDTLARFDHDRARTVSSVLRATTNPLVRDMAQRLLTK